MKLNIFDFDHTLVNTPVNTLENIAKYEAAMGIPWKINKEMAQQLTEKLGRTVYTRKGWFGRPETLEPPLVDDPAPQNLFIPEICTRFLESKVDPDTITIILTGRHAGLQKHVLRILNDGNLIQCDRIVANNTLYWITNVDPQVQVYCLGQNGPFMEGSPTKPPDTLPWKIWIINQYLKHNDIELIEMWEDRNAHMIAFYEAFPDNDTIVHYVPDITNIKEIICTKDSPTDLEK